MPQFCEKCATPLDDAGRCVTCDAEAEGLALVTRSGYASVREMMSLLEVEGLGPEMEKVPPARPEERAHPLWNLYVPRDAAPRALEFLRKDWAELLDDPEAAAAAARGQAGSISTRAATSTCPACGHCSPCTPAPSPSARIAASCSARRRTPRRTRPGRSRAERRMPQGAHRSPHPRRRRGRAPRPLVHRARSGLQAPGQRLLGVRGAHLRAPGQGEALDEYLPSCTPGRRRFSPRRRRWSAASTRSSARSTASRRVSHIELRFNPMKRNVDGERDLDHIIHAALRGMDRAVLEYGVRAGLIFCLAREFDHALNEILVDKAIKYRRRGVVGIDLAGTEKNALELAARRGGALPRALRARARAAGLKTTVHTGETAGTGAEGVSAVVEELEPHRIGHGIRAAYDERAMELLRERGVVLEICPTSNLATRGGRRRSRSSGEIAPHASGTRGVKFTINTDGPYLLDTNMRSEVRLLRDGGVLSDEQIDQALGWAREATFIEAA